MCLLVIRIPFFGEMSVQVLCPFSNLFVFLLSSFRKSLSILYINFLPGICFTNIFSYSMYCLLTLWVVSFDVQFLEFSWSPVCPFIPWMSVPLVSSSSSHCQIQCCEPSSLFASKRFIVLGLTFRSWSHLSYFFMWCNIRV